MHILTGTWEEIKMHEAELVGRQVRLTVLPEPSRTPNYAMLEAMREAEEIESRIVPKSGADSVALVREARAGGMYGYETRE